MKLLYEASNSLEAHMILNLLEQVGLSGRIDGELLQGGMGELPASGLVRIMVAETDYTQARQIIQQWEQQQPAPAVVPATAPASSASRSKTVISFLGGLIIGIAAMAVYFQTPVSYDGVDYNGDGLLDEQWTYINHRLTKTEIDRNRDGRMDFVLMYNQRQIPVSAIADNNFDGLFETDIQYKEGQKFLQFSDTDGDGEKDYRIDFSNDLPKTISFLDSATRHIIKVQHLDGIKIIKTEVDTDKDGILDTVYTYDANEDVVKEIRQ